MEETVLDADEWGERIGKSDEVMEPQALTEAQIRWKDEDDTQRIFRDNQIDAFQTVDDDDYGEEDEDEVQQPEETPRADYAEDQYPFIDLPRVIPSEQGIDNYNQLAGPVCEEPAMVPTISPADASC
jgi:hypothetical protein